MSRTVISIVLAFASISLLMGCRGRGGVEQPETPPEPVTEVAFAKGADVSWASEMEKQGIVFADSQGRVGIYPVLKGTGVNSIRLRVWVDPYDEAHWSGVVDVVNMAKRARNAGMAIMIDFHYSDIFADPGRQTIPSSWASYSKDVSKVASAVSSHTVTVLNALKSAGVVPAWVQVGNETDNGMVWDAGKIDWNKSGSARYSDYVKVSNAGYDAVKQVFPSAPVIVHISDAYKAGDYDGWFFKEFKEAGGKFDIIGLSHYPMTDVKIDGQKATLIAQKYWGSSNWVIFNEYFAREQSILMLKGFLEGQLKLQGATVSDQEVMAYSRTLIEETQRKRLA